MMKSILFTSLMGIFLLAGCGGGGEGPELGVVKGVVTVNGKPTAGLTVYFESPTGASAVGTTNAEGRYELSYPGDRMGAELGPHVVRIQGRDSELSESMLDEIATTRGITIEELKEVPVIPAKYNEQSTLAAEVESGSNEFNFDLEI